MKQPTGADPARAPRGLHTLRKWQWHWRRLMEQIWPRVTLYALASVGVALLGVFLGPYLPESLAFRFDAAAVEAKLSILASSMLAVSTFSLGVMTSAFASASASATPRVTQLLLSDKTSQNVLATFLGAFVFSLVGTITLQIGIYGAQGRLLLFAATILVYVVIVMTFVRWVHMLRTFGRLDDAVARVDAAATASLRERLQAPYLGCHPLRSREAIPAQARAVRPASAGYLAHIDLATLEERAEAVGCEVYLPHAPGSYIFPGDVIAYVSGAERLDDAAEAGLRDCFTLGRERTFDQDPRFGLVVLAEIASRALSPAINDPGTAIMVLTHGVRILARWEERAEAEVRFPHLWLEVLRAEDLCEDFFRPIMRDGAGMVEVQQWLQRSLLALAEVQGDVFGRACVERSAEALERAEGALTLQLEKDLVRKLAEKVAARAGGGHGTAGEI